MAHTSNCEARSLGEEFPGRTIASGREQSAVSYNINHEPQVKVSDLRPSEVRLVTAMQQLGYGRFESLHIDHGEFILNPWPTTVRSVKFGNSTPNRPVAASEEFQLMKPVIELITYVRNVERGTIRSLEIRGGLPFFMEIADEPVACERRRL
jgi:hypothetical protein